MIKRSQTIVVFQVLKASPVWIPIMFGFLWAMTSCGENPTKKVEGVSIKSAFLATNSGNYSNAAGDFLSLTSDGQFKRGNFKYLQTTVTLFIPNENTNGSPSYIANNLKVKIVNKYDNQSFTLGISQFDTNTQSQLRALWQNKMAADTQISDQMDIKCSAYAKGILNDVVKVPVQKKGVTYSWEISEMQRKGVQYGITFFTDSQTTKEISIHRQYGSLSQLIPSSLTTPYFYNWCESVSSDSNSIYYNAKEPLGILNYSKDLLEVSTADNESHNTVSKIDQRFYIKEGTSERKSVSEVVWPWLTGRFVTAKEETKVSTEKDSQKTWVPEEPHQEFLFDAKEQTLVWKKEPFAGGNSSASSTVPTCGFTLTFQLKDFFVEPSPLHRNGYFEAQFQLKEKKIIHPDGMLQNQVDSSMRNDNYCRLIKKIDEMDNIQSLNQLHIYIHVGPKYLSSSSSPWDTRIPRSLSLVLLKDGNYDVGGDVPLALPSDPHENRFLFDLPPGLQL